MPLWYDNWFVPQGYAFVAMDSAGLGQSGGCADNLGLSSRDGAVAALDYLSGQTPGVALGEEVTADWSNGSGAMVGTSADALHALLAATTGHAALKAVIPISSLTSSHSRTSMSPSTVLPCPQTPSSRAYRKSN